MTKLIVVALALGIGAYFAYAKVLRPAPKRACAHLRTMCSDTHEDDAKDCDEFFDAIRNNASPDDANKTADCVLTAQTCPAAFGCMAGGALKLGTGAASSFLDGFQKAIH